VWSSVCQPALDHRKLNFTKDSGRKLHLGSDNALSCLQTESTGEPRGFVFLDGDFFSGHHEEIEQLLRKEAKRAAADNPLARAIEFKRGDSHKLTVSTTTEHLAQRLGHALEKAFGGSVFYEFDQFGNLLTWSGMDVTGNAVTVSSPAATLMVCDPADDLV
jgi:hypothetical protein